MYVDVEVRTPKGRVDMVMRTPTTLYVVELKLNKTADIALEQINLRNLPGALRPLWVADRKVGLILIVGGIRWGIGLLRVLCLVESYRLL